MPERLGTSTCNGEAGGGLPPWPVPHRLYGVYYTPAGDTSRKESERSVTPPSVEYRSGRAPSSPSRAGIHRLSDVRGYLGRLRIVQATDTCTTPAVIPTAM